MALATYGDLKTAITTWLNRSDTGFTAACPDFVALAEADIRRDVRMQAQEAYASGTLAGDTLAFPARFVEAKRLTIGGTVYQYVTAERYADVQEQSGSDYVYTIIGEYFYINNGASGDSYTLIYFAGFAAFSADADYNALLTAAPDVYLFGACKHAAMWIKDDGDTAKYAAAYQAAVGRVNLRERAKSATGARLFVRAA